MVSCELNTAQTAPPSPAGRFSCHNALTANGQYPLTYDAIGNLKSYGGWTFEWEAGRQLKRQTQNATVVTYDYDSNGLRVRKTVANTSGYVYTTYNYTWHGDQLAHMTKGSDVLHFFYDAQSRPAKVDYNGTIYTYIHNLQGDVVQKEQPGIKQKQDSHEPLKRCVACGGYLL